MNGLSTRPPTRWFYNSAYRVPPLIVGGGGVTRNSSVHRCTSIKMEVVRRKRQRATNLQGALQFRPALSPSGQP